MPIGSGKAVITLLGQRNQNGPAAYEESFQAAQLRGRRMAAGAAAGAALQKDATSNHHSAGSKQKVLPSEDNMRVMQV